MSRSEAERQVPEYYSRRDPAGQLRRMIASTSETTEKYGKLPSEQVPYDLWDAAVTLCDVGQIALEALEAQGERVRQMEEALQTIERSTQYRSDMDSYPLSFIVSLNSVARRGLSDPNRL